MPGTEMKVTPEMGAPIMAMATIIHGARRLPLKNVESVAAREEIADTMTSMAK